RAGQGILGSAVIKGQATEVIAVGHSLPLAFSDWFTRKEMRPSAGAQSVLLVDDSAFFRNMLAPVIKAAGYRVRVVPNAQEGLTALRSGQTFDVVLTDIEMPDMNGFEFAETIRADQHLSAMPIIALSSLVSLASSEIAGVLNLRGRIVTVVNMRARLGLPKADDGQPPMAVGVDLRGESYGLLIDQIGEVLRLAEDSREENPVNLDPRMAKL